MTKKLETVEITIKIDAKECNSAVTALESRAMILDGLEGLKPAAKRLLKVSKKIQKAFDQANRPKR